jgi:GNAT superfamily N-acetyltransferase
VGDLAGGGSTAAHYPGGVNLPSRRLLVLGAVVVFLLVGVAAVFVLHSSTPIIHPPPGCAASDTVDAEPNGAPTVDVAADQMSDYPMSPEQADNAATVAAVGDTMGMTQQAITVALATALQESGLRNLPYGDRDSIGLFQQRPSQGWGSAAQVADPTYASRAFYRRLDKQPNWTSLDVNDAAQRVQRSAVPDAYGQWEGEARAIAAAFTGAVGASFSCHDLPVGLPESVLVTVAKRELGTAALSGVHSDQRGRQIGSWLVAHAIRFGIDRVTVNGSTWTAASGEWTPTGPADAHLSLHQVGAPGH